jgi:hypothetical protein
VYRSSIIVRLGFGEGQLKQRCTLRARPAFISRATVIFVLALLFVACEKSPSAPGETFGLAPTSPTLFVGSAIRLDPANRTTGDVSPIKWSSSNEGIVSVDATGLITGIAAGTASIRALGADGFAETAVTVVAGGSTMRAGYLTTCGIATDGALYCWGLNNRGQVGIGNTVTPQPSPAKVNGGLAFTSVTVAFEYACGMTVMGPYCWGSNAGRMIGDGTEPADPRSPVKVKGGEIFKTIEAGGAFDESAAFCSDASCASTSCGLAETGDVYCWRAIGSTATRLVLLPVTNAPRLRRISVGMDHVCGIDLDGRLWCWGGSAYKQTGVSGFDSAPHEVARESFFQQISAGREHTCGIDLAGDAYCWGANGTGQLGAPSSETCSIRFIDFTCRATPQKVEGGFKFLAIAAGSASTIRTGVLPSSHTCGITVTLEMVCWGYNAAGQLGDGSTTDRSSPARISGGLRFRSVSAGVLHTCGVTLEGNAYCWGRNTEGQLGNGTLNASSVPTASGGGLVFK